MINPWNLDQLAQVGIRLKMENIEWGQWIERILKNKEYQLTIIGHTTDTPGDIRFTREEREVTLPHLGFDHFACTREQSTAQR